MLAVTDSVDSATHGDAIHAHKVVVEQVLAKRDSQGRWEGELQGSPLATAAAVSALVVSEHGCAPTLAAADRIDLFDSAYQSDLSELLVGSLLWLAERQNLDGGWSDAPGAPSSPITTLVILSAFRLTGVPARFADLEPRAEQYLKATGGVAAVKRDPDQDHSVITPVITLAALAGIVPWRSVPTIRFELSRAPRWLQKLLGEAAPPARSAALIATGLAQMHRAAPFNPLTRWLRAGSSDRALKSVAQAQSENGAYFQATGYTAFVVTALAAAGFARHRIVRLGVEYLLSQVRADGSWPLIADLTVRNTARAMIALGHADPATAEWLISCQHQAPLSSADASPGGWAWTSLSGAPANTLDTATVLQALSRYASMAAPEERDRVVSSIQSGVQWLLATQNDDGGWPFLGPGVAGRVHNESDVEMTAVAVDALMDSAPFVAASEPQRDVLTRARGFIEADQAPDGSWTPLWLGSPRRADGANDIAGTALAVHVLWRLGGADSQPLRRGVAWLLSQRHQSGGWGAAPRDKSGVLSLEETCATVDALIPLVATDKHVRRVVDEATRWLASEVASPTGLRPTTYRLHIARRWLVDSLHPVLAATKTLSNYLQTQPATGATGADLG